MPTMRSVLKRVVMRSVDLLAAARGFSFPAKYTWRWKWDMLSGRYEPETTALFEEILKPGDTVIDAGAHIGYFSRLAAEKVGRNGHVYAFEPDIDNRELLIMNTRDLPSVEVLEAALTHGEGTVPFYHVPDSSGCHSTIPQERASIRYAVAATSLDAFVANKGIGRIALIKMDVEGGEWNALQGMKNVLSQKDLKLVMEFNPAALTRAQVEPGSVLDHLAAQGFSIFALSGSRIPLAPPFAKSVQQHLSEDGSVNIYCYRV